MSSAKIMDNVFWCGVFDPNMRIFDIVIPTEKGTTYNSYLIAKLHLATSNRTKSIRRQNKSHIFQIKIRISTPFIVLFDLNHVSSLHL